MSRASLYDLQPHILVLLLQVYVVFAFADGGSDLEHFTVRDYAEAVSLLLQVTASLAVAEQACSFEHRDMHWYAPSLVPAALLLSLFRFVSRCGDSSFSVGNFSMSSKGSHLHARFRIVGSLVSRFDASQPST